MYAYVVLSLLTGARTEELRALRWDDIDLLGRPHAQPPIPPHIAVWRSVRPQGDTKTRKSRRTIALPARCVDVLSELRRQQVTRPGGVGSNGLVFSTATGAPGMRQTCAAPCVQLSVDQRGSLRDSGLPESCDTASCRCFQIRGCPSKRSPGSWDTAARPRPSWCTASRSAPSYRRARSSWMSCLVLAGTVTQVLRSPAPRGRNRAVTSGFDGGRYKD